MQCEELTKQLAEKDQQLLVAIRRFKELEELLRVPINGHSRPENQLSLIDNKSSNPNNSVRKSHTSAFDTRVRRIQDIFESHIKRIYATSAESQQVRTRQHPGKKPEVNPSDKSSMTVPERKTKTRRKRKSSKRVCNLSFSSDHSFTKTELTEVTSQQKITTILIPGITINDVIMQTPYNWEPTCLENGENQTQVRDVVQRTEKLDKEGGSSRPSRRRSTADSVSSETGSDFLNNNNNNGAESSSSHCMEIREMSILSISPRTSYVSSAEFTDASAYSDSSTDSDKYS